MTQPAVEVRFDDLGAAALAPAGSSEGLFTVGVDLKVKALVRPRLSAPAACAAALPPSLAIGVGQACAPLFVLRVLCMP